MVCQRRPMLLRSSGGLLPVPGPAGAPGLGGALPSAVVGPLGRSRPSLVGTRGDGSAGGAPPPVVGSGVVRGTATVARGGRSFRPGGSATDSAGGVPTVLGVVAFACFRYAIPPIPRPVRRTN